MKRECSLTLLAVTNDENMLEELRLALEGKAIVTSISEISLIANHFKEDSCLPSILLLDTEAITDEPDVFSETIENILANPEFAGLVVGCSDHAPDQAIHISMGCHFSTNPYSVVGMIKDHFDLLEKAMKQTGCDTWYMLSRKIINRRQHHRKHEKCSNAVAILELAKQAE